MCVSLLTLSLPEATIVDHIPWLPLATIGAVLRNICGRDLVSRGTGSQKSGSPAAKELTDWTTHKWICESLVHGQNSARPAVAEEDCYCWYSFLSFHWREQAEFTQMTGYISRWYTHKRRPFRTDFVIDVHSANMTRPAEDWLNITSCYSYYNFMLITAKLYLYINILISTWDLPQKNLLAILPVLSTVVMWRGNK